MNILNVGSRHQNKIAGNAVQTDGSAAGLRIPPRDREPLFLHSRQDVALQVPEMRQFIDEEHALVRFVNRPGDDTLVGKRAELRMAAVRVVPNIA